MALRCQEDVGAARDRHARLAALQALAGEVGGVERRRAGGVEGEARTGDPQQMRDAPGQHRVRDAGGGEHIEAAEHVVLAQRCCPLPRVVFRHESQDHGDALSVERVGHDARVLERIPGHLDHQALVRLHADGVARRESEGLRIEELRVVDEAAQSGIDLAGDAGARVVEVVDVVAERDAVLGDLAHRVAPAADDLPQLFRAARVGEAAADADDRDRAVASLRAGVGAASAHAGSAACVLRSQTRRPTGASVPTESGAVSSSSRSAVDLEPALLDRADPDLERADLDVVCDLVAEHAVPAAVRHELVVAARRGGSCELLALDFGPRRAHEGRGHVALCVVEEVAGEILTVGMADRSVRSFELEGDETPRADQVRVAVHGSPRLPAAGTRGAARRP